MTREEKLLDAAKYALASIRLNKLKLPMTERKLECAIRDYGKSGLQQLADDIGITTSEAAAVGKLMPGVIEAARREESRA